jgi:hypothetical protein
MKKHRHVHFLAMIIQKILQTGVFHINLLNFAGSSNLCQINFHLQVLHFLLLKSDKFSDYSSHWMTSGGIEAFRKNMFLFLSNISLTEIITLIKFKFTHRLNEEVKPTEDSGGGGKK